MDVWDCQRNQYCEIIISLGCIGCIVVEVSVYIWLDISKGCWCQSSVCIWLDRRMFALLSKGSIFTWSDFWVDCIVFNGLVLIKFGIWVGIFPKRSMCGWLDTGIWLGYCQRCAMQIHVSPRMGRSVGGWVILVFSPTKLCTWYDVIYSLLNYFYYVHLRHYNI